ANNAEDVQSFKNQHSSYGRIDALRSLLVMDRSSRVERPDEISYVFDRESGLLRPKASGMRRLGQPPVPFHAICQRHETMKATGQQSDKSLSSLLCFYLFILDHLLSLSSLVAMIKLHLLQFAFNMKGLLDDQ
ncbi:hypothetical protein BOX15_Mlig018370g3, partial [Macrostomum lignano]